MNKKLVRGQAEQATNIRPKIILELDEKFGHIFEIMKVTEFCAYKVA